ncbi:PepSY-associated TM helix domain-containing protein [Paenibacillus sp. GCM10023252]|uniref:PepSY-associated TM helix domain-containing protein n=1 Tax=Paenibacillus sp. GCM10023252 TaxID=3252649 RepID=UPI00361A3CCE
MNEQKVHGDTAGRAGLYRFIWRWHFYAGLLFAPILVMLAVTGGLYLFKPYVEPLMHPGLHNVQVGSEALPPSKQLAAVAEAYPDGYVMSFTDVDDKKRATEIGLMKGDTAYTVFVNPYTGKLLGELQNDKRLMSILIALHGELMVGEKGDIIVELSASWAIILLATGLYLYWPRSKQTFLDVFRIRMRQGKRLFWRDLHASTGFWMSAILLVLILTGLPWASSFGDRLGKVVEAGNLSNAPVNLYGAESTMVMKDVAETNWAAENLPLPESVYAHTGMLPIEYMIQLAADKQIEPGYTVTMPEGDTGVYVISTYGWAAKSVSNYATMNIDQYSGEVLVDYRWKDYSPFDKTVEIGIALHEGRYFGWPNLLIGLLACLSLVLIAASGIIMWWKRRPAGSFGAPASRKLEGNRVRIGLIVLTILLAALMPLVGISILAVVVIDLIARLARRLRRS